MQLSEVVANNFCSCQALRVPLGRFNPIIGYNNSGKSNILKAISWLLRKSVLQAHAFNDVQQPVTVEGQIDNVNLGLLPANQQTSLAPYLVNGSLRFRRRQDAPSCPIAQLRIDVFDANANSWVLNPVGLDNAIGVLFPEPLHIEAMEDAGEDVGKFGAKNTIGLLLKYVLEGMRANNVAALQAIQTALQAVGGHLNGPARVPELSLFEAAATQAIGSFFPGLTLHVDIGTPLVEDLFKAATVSLSDLPGCQRPFASFGHGAQRSAHMALIKLLADQARQGVGNGATVVLLIDEPELYLHPQAIELLREALKSLSLQNFQVVFSTHSPLLIDREDVMETIMIYKNAGNATAARQKLASAAQIVANHSNHAEVIFSIQNSTYLMFSEKVLLVEGKTELMVLPAVYEHVRGHSVAHDKGCIVVGSSSSSIPPMMAVLTAVGFAPRAVVDLDYVFKVAPGAGQVNPASQPFTDCLAWFAANQALLGIALDASGLPMRKYQNGTLAAVSAAEAFELLAAAMQPVVRQLTQSLLPFGIWVWSRGAIEAHLGIQKNDVSRLQFVATLKASGNLLHATHAQDAINLADWI
jgi:putative ATP-dependent endonuclease of the OLD family